MFRELARRNREISKEECAEILTRETRGVLSVNGEDGYPYGMPMNHYYNPEDGCIYFHCGKKGHRLDALKASDKVCFCVFEQGTRKDDDWAYTVRSVIVFGRMEVLEDMEQIVAVTTELCHKFPCSEQYIKDEIAQSAAGTLLLKLTPEHICGKKVKEA